MKRNRGKHSSEKSLIKIRENSLFFRIINFIKSLFIREKVEEKEELKEDILLKEDNPKEEFLSGKSLEEKLDAYRIDDEKNRNAKVDEETILEIQRKYEAGSLDETTLSTSQINALYALYIKQINELRESNDFKKDKLEEYRQSRKKEEDSND